MCKKCANILCTFAELGNLSWFCSAADGWLHTIFASIFGTGSSSNAFSLDFSPSAKASLCLKCDICKKKCVDKSIAL